MKNKSLMSVIIAFILGVAGFGGYQMLGSRADAPTNMMGYLTSSMVTTTASVPIKVLSMDSNRRYAVISNPSDTAIYLYFTNETWVTDNSGGTPATSTITSLNGVFVNTKESYVINPDNLIYGNVWASSTAASKQINVSYK